MTCEHRTEEIDGIVYQEIEGLVINEGDGVWFAWIADPMQIRKDVIPVSAGRIMKVQIDYCPWCGKRLED